jgi:hypothetical protein
MKRMDMTVTWIMYIMGMVVLLVRRKSIDSEQAEMAATQPDPIPVAKIWLHKKQ